MLEQYLSNLTDEELKTLTNIYLGDKNTILSRQKMVEKLISFFSQETIDNLLSSLKDDEILILSLLSLTNCSLSTFKHYTQLPEPLLLNYLYYLKIKLLVIKEDSIYRLNPILKPERVINYNLLFHSEKSDIKNPIIDRNTIIGILNYFYSNPCPVHPTHLEKYLKSSTLQSIFPRLKSEKVHDLAKHILLYLLDHNDIEIEDNHYVLKANKFLKYLNLNTISLLSLFIFDTLNKNEIKFLTTLSKIGKIKKDKFDDTITELKKLLNVDIKFLSSYLYLFDIAIDDENEIKLNCSYEDTYSSFVQFNSDLSSFYQNQLQLGSILPLVATVDKVDTLTIYTINKQCLTKALDYFSSIELIISKLSDKVSPLPQLVISRLNAWFETYSRIGFVEGVVMYANDTDAKIIDSLPLLQIHIVKKLSPTVYLMKKETMGQWRRILLYAGFENLSGIKGEKIEEDEVIENIECPKIEEEKSSLTKVSFTIAAEDKAKATPLLNNNLLIAKEQIDMIKKRDINSVFPFDVKAKQVMLESLLRQPGRDVLVSFTDYDFYAVVLDLYKENSIVYTSLFNLETHEIITTAVSKIYTLTLF